MRPATTRPATTRRMTQPERLLPRHVAACGFTLVELLAVMTIFAILVSLSLPAITAARESARRMTCQSNLHRQSIAMQAYYDAQGHLPAGVTNDVGPVTNDPNGVDRSWTVELLPYLDESTIFNHVDLNRSVYDPANQAARAIKIRTLVCPSSSHQNTTPPLSHYAGVHHDVEAPIDADNHGVLFLNSQITREDISDGEGYTLLIGEKRVAESAMDLGWMSGTPATLRNSGTPINRTAISQNLAVGGFGSHHIAGANFLFVDGEVRFLSQDLDQQILQQLGHRADGQLLDFTDVE